MVTQQTVRFVDVQAQTRDLQPQISQAMQSVVDKGNFILGDQVAYLEREFAAYCGVDHAVGVDSGLSALELALRASGIGPGDEVITQANTFIATAGAILAVGAQLILTDCDEQGAMDIDAVSAAITPRTRAIVPVHLFGRICDIDAICTMADKHGIIVIEDAAQAHGARLHGRRAGDYGVAAAFSFYPGKNLGAFGDAGMLVTQSADIADTVRTVRNYGQREKYQHVALPLNRRLDTIQAAVLRVKLPHLDGWNQQRQKCADAYRERLQGLPLELPSAEAPDRHVYHLFVIQTEDRDALQQTLRAAGIETGIHYPIPLHLQPVFEPLGYVKGEFPRAERLARHSLSLPMYPELPLDALEYVAHTIREHFEA